MFGGAQLDVGVPSDHAQQEPDLLLSTVMPAPFAPDPVVRDVVAQPVARAPDDAHVLRLQPDFFVQFAQHRLFGRLAALDSALRKLP